MTLPGPLTRTVADSALIYDVIRDGGPSLADAAASAPERLRIAVSVRTPPLTGVQVDAEQRGAVERIAAALRDLGHEVIEREIEYPASAAATVLTRYLRGCLDQARAMPHTERLSRRGRAFVRMGAAIPAAALARARAAERGDAEVMNRVFEGGVDAVLTPIFTRRPLRVGEFEGRSAPRTLNGAVRFVPFAAAANHTGQPAAAVPAGLTADGFPLAAQLAAPADGEPVLLALAAQLEPVLGQPGRRPERFA
jgi:amidase